MNATISSVQNSNAKKILIITGDPIGKKLAGPAIRALNFARELSADQHSVRLMSLQSAELELPGIDLVAVSTGSQMKAHENWADIIIVQGNALVLFPVLAKTKKYLVVDVYDPMHLEQLEQARGMRTSEWNASILGANAILNHQLRIGDFFLAASDRQLHFWLGALASLGRINSRTYLQDLSLKALIDVVPFGMESSLPSQRKAVLRDVVPGIDQDSKLLIWAGGIYDWFDPETLVRAVDLVRHRRPQIKLFFMGTRHPHPGVPEMEIIARTRQLSEQLELTGTHVFFNDSWVDYEDRHNYLLEADAGVSTHFEHIETVFSFRTRILDYLWAGLPIVSTRGDTFAELVDRHELGATVAESDVVALAEAIEHVLFDTSAQTRMRENVAAIRSDFFWGSTTQALRDFCADPHFAADRVDYSPKGEVIRAVPPSTGTVAFRRIRRGFAILFTQGPVQLFKKATKSSN